MRRSLSFALLVLPILGCAAAVEKPAPAPDASDDPDASDGKADGAIAYVVNGHELTARERQWMQYVADHVLPDLPGTRARVLEIASRTAWWALKEGIFDTANAPRYSLCNSASGDHLIGPLDTCGTGRAWQVGLAAVQVPNHSLDELEQLAGELYPAHTVAEVLGAAAAEAGYEAGTATAQDIADATGSLRKSWLLRRSAVGFVACERNEVVPECIDGSLSWCYGTGWDTTRWYAPDKPAALQSIHDIARLLAQLGDGSASGEPWIGSPCSTDADCGYADGSTGFCFIPDAAAAGSCSLDCAGYCPDRAGWSTTFCIARATGGGMCAVRAGPLNHDCADLPGTAPHELARYLGTSPAPAATAVVCRY